MNLDGPSAADPVLQILSRWGVSTPVRIAALPAFQTWTGHASRWRGRLGDGREVVIEVQDTVAEPWFDDEHNVVDLRDKADAIVDDVGGGAGGLPSGVIPWLRVEHDRTRALLLWMREYSEGEVVGIPSAASSPRSLLAALQPVAEAVDWANRNLLHGICMSPDILVWHGDRVRVADWGKEAFDWLLDSRNGETRMEPESKLVTGIRAGRRSLPPRPWWPKGDRSVASFVRTWLDLRLGESQVSFMDELDALTVHERGVLLRWLELESSASSAADFLRELRSLSE